MFCFTFNFLLNTNLVITGVINLKHNVGIVMKCSLYHWFVSLLRLVQVYRVTVDLAKRQQLMKHP